ncbi:hypothetical protein GT347_20280 [Xylophilus rhododendri]|uniref:HeH/LEM domain-containing protein n=1 Tax=Xylophilus rhododendri TaxID=2697032 RepID=A0A857JAP1_9BURK|nr:hypothetical protein [Xylophilus rhododendri]QHJ00110.1 hypothetical protein GT347_20280 [Xylophilus rhododendri]
MSETIIEQPAAGCIFMYRGGQRAEVNENSIGIMSGLGWAETDGPAAPTRAELDVALAALPGNYTDPEYVVKGMRQHFGELFTGEDEAKVRELVTAPEKKASDGLKVDELKAALAARGVEIPDGVTLKADLAVLLDNAPAA